MPDEREQEESRGFTVVDRRGVEDEEETAAAETAPPAPPPRAAAEAAQQGAPNIRPVNSEAPQPAAPQPAAQQAGGAPNIRPVESEAPQEDAHQGAGAQALPPADFTGFLISIASSALLHMGLIADPRTGQPVPANLALARHTIDTLEILQQKTRGNLSAEEEQTFRNLLTELRMRMVQAEAGGAAVQ